MYNLHCLTFNNTFPSAPKTPSTDDLISVNASAVSIHLYSWESGGCPITSFAVTHQLYGSGRRQSPAILAGTASIYTISKLRPLTWYQVKINANNAAGATSITYKLATTSLTGGKHLNINIPNYL